MYFKNLFKSILISLIILIVLTFIMTLFNYIGLINIKFVKIFSYILPFISLFVGGFKLGKKSINKGWLEGIKLGLLFIFIVFLINFILFNSISSKHLILYIIILIGSILGSMVGISKKKVE